ncbi:Uncharacterised protein [Bifidobacterium catenulatum]|nr:Uncharacterised protein [Bifidobacterium catenulatum]
MTKSNICFSILTLDFGRTMVVIFYCDLWDLLQFSVIFTVYFHCVLLCGFRLCQVLKSSQTNRIANRLFG